MPFVISAVVLAFAGAASSQLFAAIHDGLRATPSPVGGRCTSIVRMALTAGWIVGPWSARSWPPRSGRATMLVATAVFTLAQICRWDSFAHPAGHRPRPPSTRRRRGPADRLPDGVT